MVLHATPVEQFPPPAPAPGPLLKPFYKSVQYSGGRHWKLVSLSLPTLSLTQRPVGSLGASHGARPTEYDESLSCVKLVEDGQNIAYVVHVQGQY